MSRVLPILFNTDEVRATLDGRKTVKRRVIKPQPKSKLCYTFAGCDYGTWTYPADTAHEYWGEEYKLPDCITDEDKKIVWNPPYHTDDILYVRETIWQKTGHYLDVDGETKAVFLNEFRYVATDVEPEVGWNYSWVKRPSIHVPKEAARIWLRVTDVRVERLQDIKPEDLRKEGMHLTLTPNECKSQFNKLGAIYHYEEARENFSKLWNSAIKKTDLDRYGWDANPWVWVIEFECCEKPKEWR